MQTWPPHKRKVTRNQNIPVPYFNGLETRKKRKVRLAPINTTKGKPGIKFI